MRTEDEIRTQLAHLEWMYATLTDENIKRLVSMQYETLRWVLNQTPAAPGVL